MKKFNTKQSYKEANHYDGETNIWTMKILSRTEKTVTAEFIKPNNNAEIKTCKILSCSNAFQKEMIKFKHLYFEAI